MAHLYQELTPSTVYYDKKSGFTKEKWQEAHHGFKDLVRWQLVVLHDGGANHGTIFQMWRHKKGSHGFEPLQEVSLRFLLCGIRHATSRRIRL